MRLYLVAFVVGLGLSSVHPKNELKTDPSKLQENFRNFFDSIGNNDGLKSQIYRDLLGKEAAKEQQAFDGAKEELQETRKRSAHRQRNLRRRRSNGEICEKAAVFKREATENQNEPGHQMSDEAKNEYAATPATAFAYYSDPKEELRALRGEVNYYRDLKKKLKDTIRNSEDLFTELSNTLRELMDAVESSSPPDLVHNYDGLFYEGEACVEKVWRFHERMLKMLT